MRRRHSMPFGAELTSDGTRFALWAPSADAPELVLGDEAFPLARDEGGWWSVTVPGMGPGSRYRYRLGDLAVPDPASRFQPEDVQGSSLVVDPDAFAWTDENWTGRPWEEAVIYEVHIGTATPEGTYAAFERHLPSLRKLGVTAIEIMPVADFPGGRNWGYDGVLPFAPDARYGTPDDLKRLVDRAHALGLMVFLDVVYNHFGPVGNYLSTYARSFFTDRHHTPWGDGLNFDGEDGGAVRDFFVHNALYWLEEYHLDGLRFDAVHAILDDSEPHILAELATSVRSAFTDRHVHLILENERNEARWLERAPDGRPDLHSAQWADDGHHCWHVLLTGETEGYYEDYADRPAERLGRALAEGFVYQGEPSRHGGGKPRGSRSAHLPPSAFVAFLQNHDQIGNRALGERLCALVPAERLALARAALLLSPQVPMLFMGEEFSASTPFQFFVDFSSDPDLSQSVRDGRRREFAHFAAFADGAETAVPDPTDPATFRRSVLDWSEAESGPGREVWLDTQDLLRLRRDAVVPLTRTPFLGATVEPLGQRGLDVTWRFAAGRLRLLANFADEPVDSGAWSGTPLWASPGIETGGPGTRLPAWTGLFMIEGA